VPPMLQKAYCRNILSFMTSEDNLAGFAAKKAFEINYAIFRIADSIRQSGRIHFAIKLEERAIDILDSAIGAEFGTVVFAIAGLDYFLKLGSGTGMISDLNASVLEKELASLNAVIAELNKISKQKEVKELNISDIFSKASEYEDAPEAINKELLAVAEDAVITEPKDTSGNLGRKDNANGAENRQSSNIQAPSGTNPAIRQSVILNRIRQNHNCRLKDIQEFLPDSSERTIRYDLQDLIRQGIVVRIGSGGPATYYQIAELVAG